MSRNHRVRLEVGHFLTFDSPEELNGDRNVDHLVLIESNTAIGGWVEYLEVHLVGLLVDSLDNDQTKHPLSDELVDNVWKGLLDGRPWLQPLVVDRHAVLFERAFYPVDEISVNTRFHHNLDLGNNVRLLTRQEVSSSRPAPVAVAVKIGPSRRTASIPVTVLVAGRRHRPTALPILTLRLGHLELEVKSPQVPAILDLHGTLAVFGTEVLHKAVSTFDRDLGQPSVLIEQLEQLHGVDTVAGKVADEHPRADRELVPVARGDVLGLDTSIFRELGCLLGVSGDLISASDTGSVGGTS